MDPNATPWRSLDSEAPVEADQPVRGTGVPLPALVAGGGAVILVVAAFLLAFGSGGGVLVVAGDQPLPAASGGIAPAPIPDYAGRAWSALMRSCQ